MKRRIVKQGTATMMVSLPAKWIRKFNLKKGDEVYVEEFDKGLIIKTDSSLVNSNKAIIDVTGFNPLVNRILISFYVRGIDELEVRFSNTSEVSDFQKRVINELIGFEIIKQTNSSLIIKDIATVDNQNIDEVVNRIFLILDSMADELVNSISKKQDLKPIIDMDSSINKFVNFCLRILNKKGYIRFDRTLQMYSIVSLLEEIGDLYKKISLELKKNKNLANNDVSTIRELKEFLHLYHKLLFNFNKKEAVIFANKYEAINKKLKQKNLVDIYLFQILETIIRMNNHLLVVSF
ncbi:phosphate uptake regulator PhoU [Candidatus Woesearchaeota archaeon]|nr:phosphate uptake regulator PhoU [Candidatus Woesearchaeota archaeon]